MFTKTVTAIFNGVKSFITSPKYQYDYGQMLIFKKINLPEVYEVHFSNSELGNSKTSIGNSNGVIIPGEYFLSGDPIFVWLFLHE